MAVLAMDSATVVTAVAVGDANGLKASQACIIPRGHSRLLQPMIAAALGTAGLATKDVTQIVVGVGPGSYTGVRLGVTTGKAMAAALGVALTPVSTLWGLAEAAVPGRTHGPAWVLPLLYARRQRAFGAIYGKDGTEWTRYAAEEVRSVEDWGQTLADWTATHPGRTVVIHDFEPRYQVLEYLPGMAEQTVHVGELAGAFGPALLRIGYSGQAESVTGEQVHGIVPDYALQVEAEAKLAQKEVGNRGSV